MIIRDWLAAAVAGGYTITVTSDGTLDYQGKDFVKAHEIILGIEEVTVFLGKAEEEDWVFLTPHEEEPFCDCSFNGFTDEWMQNQ